MLRLETETGWWLVTHPDHARLAGAFAERWGNDRFLPPEPRVNGSRATTTVGSRVTPRHKSRGKASPVRFPSNWSANIRALRKSIWRTISPCATAPFVKSPRRIPTPRFSFPCIPTTCCTNVPTDRPSRMRNCPCSISFWSGKRNFRLLQASDYLSLLTCVDFRQPAHLLHPLPLRDGGHIPVQVRVIAPRHFVLDPYPLPAPDHSGRNRSRCCLGWMSNSPRTREVYPAVGTG